MANITKVLARHDWREQKIPQLKTGFADNPDRMKLLCWNCRLPWDEQTQGSPPLTGCVSDIQVRRCGDARQRDYAKQEERRRHEQQAAQEAWENKMEKKMNDYLAELERNKRS